MTQTDLSLTANLAAPMRSFRVTRAFDEKSQALQSLLQQTGHCGLRHVSAVASDGWIVLRGRVASYYLKQLAQEAVRPMAIGVRIRNEVAVGE